MTSKFRFSQRSEENLRGVKPALVAVIRKALEVSPLDFGITEGVRTMQRQRQLVTQGKSQTMNSRHLTGEAVDVVAYIDGRVSWDLDAYRQIADVVKVVADELETPVEWGGDWKTLVDGPHFQLKR